MRGKDGGGGHGWPKGPMLQDDRTKKMWSSGVNLVSETYEKISHQLSLLYPAVFFLLFTPLIF